MGEQKPTVATRRLIAASLRDLTIAIKNQQHGKAARLLYRLHGFFVRYRVTCRLRGDIPHYASVPHGGLTFTLARYDASQSTGSPDAGYLLKVYWNEKPQAEYRL
jgi:hypothetical protein